MTTSLAVVSLCTRRNLNVWSGARNTFSTCSGNSFLAGGEEEDGGPGAWLLLFGKELWEEDLWRRRRRPLPPPSKLQRSEMSMNFKH